MNGTELQFAWLNDQRLAAHALSPTPAWLWSADASRILWGNPVAAAIFDCATPAAAAALRFAPTHPAATEIARLAAILPQDGAPRLERLLGLGAPFGRRLICMCSRIMLSDTKTAILVVATEPAGKELALPERALRLLTDFKLPAAIVTADGELIEATREARDRFGASCELTSLGFEELAREAMLNGKAGNETAEGQITVLRLGASVALLVVATVAEQPVRAGTPIVETVVANPAAAEARPRRSLFRFLWQMDAANRFTLVSEEFARLLGPKTAAALNRPWAEIATSLRLDPDGAVAAALAARGTWSGIAVDWPVDDDQRLPTEMSGLPLFDRDRQFVGFRGFGICRDVERLTALEHRWPVSPAPEKLPPEEPPQLLPFPAAPVLSPDDHATLQELARELRDRLKKPPALCVPDEPRVEQPFVVPAQPAPELPQLAHNGDTAHNISGGHPILDQLSVGILVYRLNNLIYANRAFLDWTGYSSLDILADAGGLDSLFIETKDAGDGRNGGKRLTITTVNQQQSVEGRMFSVAWNNETAIALMINTQAATEEKQSKATISPLRPLKTENCELDAILDTAIDAMVVLDRAGRVLSVNHSAKALFGYDAAEFAELSIGDLLASENPNGLLGHLDRLAVNGKVESFDAGREAIGLERKGGLVPLCMTVGRVADGGKFCAVMRDITALKRTEEVISQLNDLLDLSEIEAGKLALTFISVNLNELVQKCVAMMQEQANRQRVILRTSLPSNLPQIVADARSVRRIALNVLSNSIKFTGAGGQVIVTTALSDDHEVVLRVRDTGAGMSAEELQTALEPFRQFGTPRWGISGTGLGLPITKALTEANHARFTITSRVLWGTLVEVAFSTSMQ